MHLKGLTINGFKSFAKKSELEFSTPITAIVGPNGSGKSNVAEAFRFVLGEQSIKSMRGKKGEDLIFNGSSGASRSNRASVAIILDNAEVHGQRTFELDFDEIEIERVVHRDGTNEYSVNGSRSRLKDVQELLAAANIGSTGHHIISQGEADRILTSSPKERREMIEDALGLKVFQYKKIESERKLKKTLENIERVESLRREVKPHLRFLERQVKKIEKSLKLQEELKSFYAAYLKREDVYIAHHNDRLTEERRTPTARLEELHRELEEEKKKLEKGKKDEKQEALIALEKHVSDVRAKRQAVVREAGQIEGQISFLERRIKEIEQRAEQVSEAPIPYQEFKKAADSIEKSVQHASASDDSSLLRRALGDIVNVLNTLLKRSAHDTVAQSTKAEESELNDLYVEKKAVDKESEKIATEEKELAEEYQVLRSAIEAESTESREAERRMFELMNEEREVRQRIGVIEQELQTLERDRTDFKRELQEAVTLLGRGAAAYFEHVVMDNEGNVVSNSVIVAEPRDTQRERRRELEKMKIRLEELGAGTTEDVLKEYKEVKERDEFLVREIADLTESVTKLETLIAELSEQLNEQFISGIEKIDAEFGRFFVLMFGGGSATLKRVKPKVRKKNEDLSGVDDEGVVADEEEEESLEEGIEVDVQLPNKRVRGLDMLSGGERALTSIALIFAMSQVNPPLFVILDETDAALDEANSRRYGDMITALAERSQLILITHNRETMGRAGVLYGITMAGDGVSKLLSVKFDEALTVAK